MGTRCTGPSVIAVSTEVNTEAVWTHTYSKEGLAAALVLIKIVL